MGWDVRPCRALRRCKQTNIEHSDCMKRPSFVVTAIVAAAFLCILESAHAAESPPDFSKLDPAWAAGELDGSLRDGEMGSAWSAMKAVFPEDYTRLTRNMAEALINKREWRGLSQQFMQEHVGGKLREAQLAPAGVQLRYQQQKARLLLHLSRTNLTACAYLGTGLGDATSLASLDPEGASGYSDLIAAMVRTIGAGRDAPTIFTALSPAEWSQILSAMVAQGTAEAEARRILSGQVGATPADQCRDGLVKHKALASVSAEIVAKTAFH